MSRSGLVSFLAFVAIGSSPAWADAELSLSFDMEDVTVLRHLCGDGDPLAVVYVNSDEESLALVPVDDDTRVFASTVSGSGAIYVSGALEWATQGDTATLRDTLRDETLIECASIEG